MSQDPNARRRAQSFWKKIKGYIAEQIDRMTEIMEVIQITDEGRIVVRSFDPETDTSHELPHARGVRVAVGERVIVTTVGGHRVITHAMRPVGATEDDSLPLGGDGSSEFVARADHQHRASGDRDATVLGYGTPIHATADITATVAIGQGGVTIDKDRFTHVGSYAKAYPSNGVSIGHWTNNSGFYAVGIGNNSEATGEWTVAIGHGAKAPHPLGIALGGYVEAREQAVAIGHSTYAQYYGVAVGHDSHAEAGGIAIGRNAQATGANSIAIGHGAASSDPDTATIRANYLFVSPATWDRSYLYLKSPDGANRNIEIGSDARLYAGGVPHTKIGDVPWFMWQNNRKVSAGSSIAFRIAPGNVHNAITWLGAGTQVHDFLWNQYTDEWWSQVYVHGWGWGWLQTSRIINI